MKKKLCLALVCVLAGVLFCACETGEKTARRGTSSSIQSVNDVIEAAIAAEDAKDDASTVSADITTVEDAAKYLGIEADDDTASDDMLSGEPDPNVDVDLTVMNSIMVYSEVYNMVTEPSSYIGKKIKMDGIFDVYTDERTGKNYYACIIQDATKCCSSGIEFELAKERIYPDEYPEAGSIITVTGVFETYEEDGILYCTLRDATMNS